MVEGRSTRHRLHASCALIAALWLAGCVSEGSLVPNESDPAVVWHTTPNAAWLVRGGNGELAGYLVRFASREDPDMHWFSVRDPDHRELGTLDALGRVWRYAPHGREATWLGTGTASEGAARILGLATPVELAPIELDQLLEG